MALPVLGRNTALAGTFEQFAEVMELQAVSRSCRDSTNDASLQWDGAWDDDASSTDSEEYAATSDDTIQPSTSGQVSQDPRS